MATVAGRAVGGVGGGVAETATRHIKFTPNKLHNKVIKAFRLSIRWSNRLPPSRNQASVVGHKNVHKPRKRQHEQQPKTGKKGRKKRRATCRVARRRRSSRKTSTNKEPD